MVQSIFLFSFLKLLFPFFPWAIDGPNGSLTPLSSANPHARLALLVHGEMIEEERLCGN
jgi:hypothetical protein